MKRKWKFTKESFDNQKWLFITRELVLEDKEPSKNYFKGKAFKSLLA